MTDRLVSSTQSELDTEIVERGEEILASKSRAALPPRDAYKVINQAGKYWNDFYMRNETNFFKDRHWTDREFEELRSSDAVILLELGCGVGNFVFPLLESNPNLFIHACDFSAKAVDLLKENSNYNTTRCNAFVHDLTKQPLSDKVQPNSLDIVSNIFCLSAIPPASLEYVIDSIHAVLKPHTGILLFRDYGVYDEAELRFNGNRRISEHVYARQDGTLAVFFSKEGLKELFEQRGFEVLEIVYVRKNTVNRAKGTDSDRVFVQGKFRRL
ncbi:hypothetical protein SmJEL517_g03794 [Synchytrium microbalum]|uniref:tRNA N(3)-methylcytidine methyltransferase n=1 Tax=Synchytrium microbalum TaxID=1806994 RepID=A0A507C186_9FUNG|nr:uncharacterized protein SmJEL517_g03794 [Synchytrium microbalum]TPX33181.1 hypothetical protein SmJEL517_g03794 [Synchytrium microbalum]